MEELSIKIKIGDREYPMKVERSEEERIRKAGRELNEQMKEYGEQFGTTDRQDLLAMVAFDAFVENVEYKTNLTGMQEGIAERLSTLNKLIVHTLS
jgi:cell division protein ZapA